MTSTSTNIQEIGELIEGGQGYAYALVRFDTSNMGWYFPRGTVVDIGGWAEAESYNADGSLKHHHLAFDQHTPSIWTTPN